MSISTKIATTFLKELEKAIAKFILNQKTEETVKAELHKKKQGAGEIAQWHKCLPGSVRS